MAVDFKLRINGSVQKWGDELTAKVGEAIKGNMLQAAELAAGAVRREVFRTFNPGTSKLARSYTATLLQPKAGKLRAGAISDLVYARIQDKGGTITPKTAKALTVPISNQAKALSRSGVGAREFPTPLALIWPKGKSSGVLVSKQGVEYALKRSVDIPATNYLDKSAKAVDPELEELFDGAIDVAAGEADTK